MNWNFHKPPALLALGVAMSLAACASPPPYAPVIDVPSTFVAAPMSDMAGSVERWWLLFADNQLNQLIVEALDNAPDARGAMAVLDEARAARAQALARLGPQGNINLTADTRRSNPDGAPIIHQRSYNGGFSPSWEIDLFGRRRASRTVADADLDAARFQFEAARQSLGSAVAINLFDARANAVRLDQARQILRIASELARVGQRRVEIGIGARADAESLKADEANAKAAAIASAAQLSISKRTLLILLGRGTEPLEMLTIAASFNRPPMVPSVTPATLLIRRPDIRLAEARLRSAAGNLKLSSKALLPTISLLPSATYSATTGNAASGTSIWSLGIGLLLPILDRPRLLAELRGQRARTEQALIAYEDAVQTGFGEAQNSLLQYGADRERLSEIEQAEASARIAFEAQRAGYEAGVVDLTALLQAERTWRTNLASLSDLRVAAIRDAVAVFQALGGGWSPWDTAAQPSGSL
ncbi:efflux transporter outer membrane subunit [Sphingobium sp. AP50]|uniref:efflux transporter outer membrane subunit n=1 Tax=Sphingobium sp. AP50 TaxID=1884369 RepID=UPI001C43015F|nr:TolC family protein [Sphingobium sp. AP50]